jgi:hypothetical protein
MAPLCYDHVTINIQTKCIKGVPAFILLIPYVVCIFVIKFPFLRSAAAEDDPWKCEI